MKSAVFLLSAFLVVSCQALTPDGPVGPIIDPKIPGLIDKFPFPNPVCGPVCAIWCPNGNIMDSRGCSTCKCKPLTPDGPVGPIIDPKIPGLIDKFPFPNPVCGPVCAIWCPNGNIMDSRGCSTCKCKPLTPVGPDGPVGPIIDPKIPGLLEEFPFPNPVDPIRPVCGPVCAIWCISGYVMDSRGCPTCKCKPITSIIDPNPVCGPLCDILCPSGNVMDSRGCPTCICAPNCMKSRSCYFCPYGRTFFTDGDGCRACKCKPRPGPVTATCTYDGKTYSNGQSFKKDCNDCFCLNGKTLCTERACSIGSCRDGGKVYKHGESYKKDCNSCFCRNGRSLCTMRACLVGFDRTRLEA